MTHRLTIQYATPNEPDAFEAHYFDVHVPLCRPLPGLVSAKFERPQPLGPGQVPYLVAQLDFPDAAALQAALRSPEMAALATDSTNLPADKVMFTSEVISA